MKYIDANKLIAEIERRIEETKSMKPTFDQFWAGQISAFKGALKIVKSLQQEQPSLPSGLDDAAEETSQSAYSEPTADGFAKRSFFKRGFKAGAEWMAGQGVTTEQIVGRTPLNGPNGITVFLYDFDGFEAGDKVVVQIRKK